MIAPFLLATATTFGWAPLPAAGLNGEGRVSMAGVSKKQIAMAKEVKILDYVLAHEPNNIKRVGKAYYLKDHQSLEISNGLWNWHSQGIGGKNVVDYLIKVRGFNFVDAVRHLAGDDLSDLKPIPRAKPPPVKRMPFTLPPRNTNNERIIAYLEGRSIAKPLILDCINQGSLYESGDMWHNCVFVGRDDSGKARFAAMRGTMGDFKRDADGSDKRFGFILPSVKSSSDTVAVFESPVDLLSYKTMYPNYDGWLLSLGCTATIALKHFLECYGKIRKVIVGTDSDEPGNIAAERIAELPGISTTRILPVSGKDWSDALMLATGEKKPSLLGRLDAAKSEAALQKTQYGSEQRKNALERG
jgi:hypothetical protein